MNTKVKNKKICLVLILLLTLTLSCRKKAVPEQALKDVNVTKQISPEVKELLEFAKISLTDTFNISRLLDFKLIDENGNVTNSDSERNTKIYKNIIKGRSTSSLPIFEIIGSDKVILVMQNRGFSGSIWAKILIDNNRKEILGLQFQHMAESEGYGAGITQESYESQFVGKVFQTDLNDFGLKQNGVSLIEGNTMIDGISGSTITSKATVEMINQGLQKYQNWGIKELKIKQKMKKITKKDAKEIGQSLGINWEEVSLDEFTDGINVEFEHGTRFPETNVTNDDKYLTGKIAWAHLMEFPDYYTRLEKMEKEAEDFWKITNAQ